FVPLMLKLMLHISDTVCSCSAVEQLPTITVHPPKSLIALPFDESITLTCEAKGNPKPVFRWTKNGQDFYPHLENKLIKFENSGSFVIPNNKGLAKYQGKYRCYASNKLGTAVSEETDFTVPTPPKFPKERIEPVVVKEGDSVILECNPPKGTPPVQLYWMTMGLQHIEQDERVSMGLNGNLYFSNTLVKDSRSDYCCFASFSAIRTIVQKTAMAIAVTPLTLPCVASGLERKPNLLVPSGDQSQINLVTGEELELECISEGFPTPKIEWTKLGEKLPKRSNIKNYGKLLTISKVTEEDSGKYMCKAKNSVGETVHYFHVEVEEPPRWIEEPVRTQVVTIGSDVHIKCHAAGKPPPAITWLRDGKPLHGEWTPTQTLSNDTGVYQCEASNTHGTVLATANVMVMNHPPLILTRDYLEYATVRGKSVTMDCRVFGSPPATVHWRREDPEGSVEEERFSIHENGSLQIHTAEVEDMGKYMCYATNSQGTASISAELYVKGQRRSFSNNLSSLLECQADMDQSLREDLEILWRKDGIDIYSNFTDDSGFYIDERILYIFNANHSDGGLYTCIARTPLDEDTAAARVTVLDVPDPPVRLFLSDLRDRSVRLHWVPTKDHNSPVKEHIIEYEENHWDPGKWKPLLRVSGNQNSAPLSLYGHINYQFRVTAVNAIGAGRPSKPSERYKTPPAAPDRNPENIKIEGHVPHQMHITWKPLLPIEHNGPGLEYKLSYRQLGVEDTWTEHTMERHLFVVKDTPTFVPYEIKIQARNHLGWAPEPRVVTGYSGEDLPLAAPEDVSVVVLNSTLLRVSWSPIPQAQLRGHLGGYSVHWWRTRSLLTSKEVPAEKQFLTLTGNRSHTMVPGLKPFSEYRLTVNVFNRRGNGPSSSPLTFTTPQGVPERPPILRATNPQGDSITLVWAPPLEANGILTGYRLQYQLINETMEVDEAHTVNISGPDTTQLVLPNLKLHSQYQFYLSACTVVGCGPAVSEEEGLTLSGCGPPVGDGIWRISEAVNTSQSFHVIEGLEPETVYTVRLLASRWPDNSSLFEEVFTTRGKGMAGVSESISSRGWFVGMMCAVALLTLAVLIACFVTRNKGGKYAVKEKEDVRMDLEAHCVQEETSGEYSDSDEKPLKRSKRLLEGDVSGDDTSVDSSVDYEDEDSEFNEDGSFIGEYAGHKRKLSAEVNGHTTMTA
uniref:Neural cell adhesion molecule L1-like protein n=1 Tax=Pygocentrus nattereri TaxID=42514 RepID=A0AAR2KHA9_PYGNA